MPRRATAIDEQPRMPYHCAVAECGPLRGRAAIHESWGRGGNRVPVVGLTASSGAQSAALPSWALLALMGVLAVIFIVLLIGRGAGRQSAEERILDTDASIAPGALRRYALALVDAERLTDAESIVAAHLARVPTDVRMRALLGALCTARGDHAQAVQEYERALRTAQRTWEQRSAHLVPYVGCLQAAYSVALRAVGRIPEAERQQQEALRLDPSLAQQGGQYARLLADFARDDELERRAFEDVVEWEHGRALAIPFGLTDGAEAVRFYRAAVAARPGNPRLLGDLAQALHAVGDHTAAERQFEEALRQSPRDPWLHFHYGLMHWRREQLAEAERELAEAARLAPQRAGILGTYGIYFLRQNRFPEAENALLAAVNARPDVWTLVRLYGVVALRQGNLTQAVRAFQEADRLGANDLAFRLAFADLREQMGQLRAAEEQYRLALRLDASSGLVRAHLGGFLVRQGQLAEAERMLREALMMPESELAHLHIAGLLLLERRLDEVMDHLQVALQVDPESPQVQEYQAEWLLLRGRVAEAEEISRKAMKTQPPRASLHLVRAGTLLALNRQLEAQTALREALRAEPTLPEKLLAQAQALHELGRMGAAVEAVNQALALRPDWPDALAERDRLLQMQASPMPRARRRTFGPQR